MAEHFDWRSRIVAYGSQPADQFLAHPNNPKYHPPEQREAIRGSIKEVGQIAPIMVSHRTKYTLDGHDRIFLGLDVNAQNMDYFEIDVTWEEELYILATYDPIGMMARHDAAKLDDLLREVNSGEAGVQAMLSKLAISSGLVPTDNPYDEWTGMPEFEQDELKGFHRVTVVFETEADLNDFAERLGQTVTENTTTVFHPMRRSRGASSNRVVDEP